MVFRLDNTSTANEGEKILKKKKIIFILQPSQ